MGSGNAVLQGASAGPLPFIAPMPGLPQMPGIQGLAGLVTGGIGQSLGNFPTPTLPRPVTGPQQYIPGGSAAGGISPLEQQVLALQRQLQDLQSSAQNAPPVARTLPPGVMPSYILGPGGLADYGGPGGP